MEYLVLTGKPVAFNFSRSMDHSQRSFRSPTVRPTCKHRKQCSASAEEEEFLRVHESDSALKGWAMQDLNLPVVNVLRRRAKGGQSDEGGDSPDWETELCESPIACCMVVGRKKG